MDSLIVAASRALAQGDVLGALRRVGWRDDPSALALRGIAMAQLGEHPKARDLLRRAAAGFGASEAAARHRCVVAAAEVALAMRDLGGSPRTLDDAARALDARGDRSNALHARLVAARRLLLLGRLDATAEALRSLAVPADAPPALAAVAALVDAELRLRRLEVDSARASLERARDAAARAGIPALSREVGDARAVLDRPAARCISEGCDRPLRLDEVAALHASQTLVVDVCRRGLHAGSTWLSLARRPILLALARTLGEAGPAGATRDALIAGAFRTRDPDETHRARLRVEIGRLRTLVKPIAAITATERGFALVPHGSRSVAVLVPPIDGADASLLALLADGGAWSTSALAMALGESQRTVQRALAALEALGRVRSVGRTRTQRWLAPPLAGFTTLLLLPAALPLH